MVSNCSGIFETQTPGTDEDAIKCVRRRSVLNQFNNVLARKTDDRNFITSLPKVIWEDRIAVPLMVTMGRQNSPQNCPSLRRSPAPI